jgi:DNA-binding response OmpR family regulator
MKVLLADDDRVFVEHISTRLRQKGHAVMMAADAMQAFMFAVREQPDVIMLDINMPGGGGTDVLRRLKLSAKTMQIPVVIVSAQQDSTLEGRVRELGAVKFLSKPLQFQSLCEALGVADPNQTRPK